MSSSISDRLREMAESREAKGFYEAPDAEPQLVLRVGKTWYGVHAHLRLAADEIDEATEVVESLVDQSCHTDADGVLDSMAISTNADALRWLERQGRVEVISDSGRRVLARWVRHAEADR